MLFAFSSPIFENKQEFLIFRALLRVSADKSDGGDRGAGWYQGQPRLELAVIGWLPEQINDNNRKKFDDDKNIWEEDFWNCEKHMVMWWKSERVEISDVTSP